LPSPDDPFADAASMSAGMQPAMTPIAPGAAFGQMPAAQPQMQPAMQSSMGNPYASSMTRPKRPFKPKVKPHVWAVFISLGAGLMLLSFVSPWWGARLYHPTDAELQALREKNRKKYEEEAEKIRERMEESKELTKEEMERLKEKLEKDAEKERDKRIAWERFYRKYDIGEEDPDFKRSEIKEGESKMWLVWGWQTGSGLMGLIFGVLLLPLAIVFGFVKSLQQWSWIILFVSVGAGVAMIVVFPNWFFGTPDENSLPVLRQGVIAGPWMALVSGLTVAVCGLTGGFMGLIAFVKR